MLNNDKIERDVGDAGNVRKDEDIEDRRNGNIRDAEDIRDIVNKEIDSGNKRRNQENIEVVSYLIGVGGSLRNVEMGNNTVRDDVGN